MGDGEETQTPEETVEDTPEAPVEETEAERLDRKRKEESEKPPPPEPEPAPKHGQFDDYILNCWLDLMKEDDPRGRNRDYNNAIAQIIDYGKKKDAWNAGLTKDPNSNKEQT